MTPRTSPTVDAPPAPPTAHAHDGSSFPRKRESSDAAATAFAAAPAHDSIAVFAARQWHGWMITGLIALAAYAAQYLPFAPFRVVLETGAVRHPVGPAIIAILLGVAIRNLIRLPEPITAGGRSLVKWSIPWAIVLIGAGLNLAVVAGIGARSLGIIIVSILIAIVAAILTGRLLRLHRRTAMLLAAGTAICGNSAILAIAPIIKARDKEMLISVGVVNLIGLAFMLLLPAVGVMVALSPEQLGVWAGATIHSVPQAVAAGFAYPVPAEGAGAGEVATLVKLVRVAMLVPLVIGITLIVANGNGTLRSVKMRSLVPWFIWGFLALAAANTLVHAADGSSAILAIMKSSMAWLNLAGGILLTVALAAIGLDVDLRKLVRVGKRAVLAGLVASIAMAAVCLVMIVALL